MPVSAQLDEVCWGEGGEGGEGASRVYCPYHTASVVQYIAMRSL